MMMNMMTLLMVGSGICLGILLVGTIISMALRPNKKEKKNEKVYMYY